MIEETKGYPLLKGYRGKEPINLSALVDMILKVSDLVGKNQTIKELELNPVFAYKRGALAVDARILLKFD
jgi:acyl-CoA synthetase (NDP forming)